MDRYMTFLLHFLSPIRYLCLKENFTVYCLKSPTLFKTYILVVFFFGFFLSPLKIFTSIIVRYIIAAKNYSNSVKIKPVYVYKVYILSYHTLVKIENLAGARRRHIVLSPVAPCIKIQFLDIFVVVIFVVIVLAKKRNFIFSV